MTTIANTIKSDVLNNDILSCENLYFTAHTYNGNDSKNGNNVCMNDKMRFKQVLFIKYQAFTNQKDIKLCKIVRIGNYTFCS